MLEKVVAIIAKELDKDSKTINADTRLTEDLGADSLDAVEIIMALEDEFDIEIDDSYFQNIKTVGDIVKCIEENEK